jgi:hypothetical protein
MFQQLVDIWNTGDTTPFDLIDEVDPARYDEFKKRTGATKVVGVRWVHEGKTLMRSAYVLRLPDRSGLLEPVGSTAYFQAMLVIAPDGTERCRITVPRLDERSKPEEGYLTLMTEKIPGVIDWGIAGFDGYRYALLEFDWYTGQLKRWEEKSAMWAMHNGVFRMPPDAV